MSEKTFTQEELNKLVGDARVQAREKATAELTTQAAKDKESAKLLALEAKKEWQKLAETRGARVAELEPLEEQLKQYEEMVSSMLETSLKELGDAATKAVEGLPPMSAIDKLKWITSNKALFQGKEKSAGVGTPKHQVLGKTKLAPGSVSKHALVL